MPELAEVEFYRKRWSAGHRSRVLAVLAHPHARVYRDCDSAKLARVLRSATLVGSAAAAKQMLFRFTGGGLPRGATGWLGVHLGMSGELRVEPPDYSPQKHDHLALRQARRTLVFSDPRMFGAVLFSVGRDAPAWWTGIAPAIRSKDFTVAGVTQFLQRRRRAPIKAVLLMQARFPGIGNWMADEVLWRSAIHPKRPAGSLSVAEIRVLHRECRTVSRMALRTIAGAGGQLPPDLNVHIPRTWLFRHRWEDGGRCPRTGAKLIREEIGGRTTCWSPARQKLR